MRQTIFLNGEKKSNCLNEIIEELLPTSSSTIQIITSTTSSDGHWLNINREFSLNGSRSLEEATTRSLKQKRMLPRSNEKPMWSQNIILIQLCSRTFEKLIQNR
jgi:hypothetical protein